MLPFFRVCAQEDGGGDEQSVNVQPNSEQSADTQPVADVSVVFKAKVIKILDVKDITREDGSKSTQQNLQVTGLEGEWKNKEIQITGISEIDVVSVGQYKVGDKVLVQMTEDENGNPFYNIQDFDREASLFWLTVIFCAVVLVIGRFKGFRSLLSLGISFVILINLVLPKILDGGNPLIWGLIGSFLILLVIIYLTEGWNKKSHIAIFSVFFSLVVILVLSQIFTEVTRLTGLVSDEAIFLIGITQKAIDFRGLLLAGILIGAAGVLDDVIIAQIETVIQIKEANPSLPNSTVYKSAYKVGNTHLGAIINTLFLTYAGASLPLLLLFAVHQEPFISLSQVFSNELIATEIVRTLVGSIGIALSMPITTFFAVYLIRVKK
ncbi:MAG: YibE/F family protein [Candidatus Parcubacteria bacterium]|nr:YibE/F family protein [Candidatus Parcubacteria bacterium]